jgi:hypothetical protein
MRKTVLCISRSFAQAEAVVSNLKAIGFPDQDISVLFSDEGRTKEFAEAFGTHSPDGTAGAKEGGMWGGTIGLVAGIGALAIPGVGPLVAIGPLLGALSGAAAGVALGGVAGGLMGIGIPEADAGRYEDRIKKGDVLIAVHTESLDEQRAASEILERGGAEDISYRDEVSRGVGAASSAA